MKRERQRKGSARYTGWDIDGRRLGGAGLTDVLHTLGEQGLEGVQTTALCVQTPGKRVPQVRLVLHEQLARGRLLVVTPVCHGAGSRSCRGGSVQAFFVRAGFVARAGRRRGVAEVVVEEVVRGRRPICQVQADSPLQAASSSRLGAMFAIPEARRRGRRRGRRHPTLRRDGGRLLGRGRGRRRERVQHALERVRVETQGGQVTPAGRLFEHVVRTLGPTGRLKLWAGRAVVHALGLLFPRRIVGTEGLAAAAAATGAAAAGRCSNNTSRLGQPTTMAPSARLLKMSHVGIEASWRKDYLCLSETSRRGHLVSASVLSLSFFFRVRHYYWYLTLL